MIQKYIDRLWRKPAAISPDIFKKISIGPYTLNAHRDHSLENYLVNYPQYSRNFPRLALEVLKEQPDHTIIDVGANIGDTVALLREFGVKNHIFCVEGDEVYYSFLNENSKQFADVSLLKYYLSDTNESKHYYVESTGGTARIIEAESSNITSALITLDELSELNNIEPVGIIKIDTDGFDCKIIKGSFRLIEKHTPVLFFEYDHDLAKQQGETPLRILNELQERDYNDIIYYDNYGKIICATKLLDLPQLTIMDNYIKGGKGAFPYYDVCIFHRKHSALAHEFIAKEIDLK